MPRKFLYFLTDVDGLSYYVENGIVKKSNMPRRLPVTPDGWQEIGVAYEKDMDKLGVVRTFSTPLGFVRDGALILKNLLYTKNVEEKVFLNIQRHAPYVTANFYNLFNYEFFYKGQIDLTTFSDELFKVSCKVMEGQTKKLLKANEGTTYEIDLDTDPDTVTINDDGLLLSEKHNYKILSDSIRSTHILSTAFTTKEGNAFGYVDSTNILGKVAPSDYSTSPDYLFSVIQDIKGLTIQGSVAFVPKGSVPVYGVSLHTNTNREIQLVPPMALTAGQRYSVDFNVTFDAFNGEEFFLVGFYPENFFDITYEESDLSISFKSKKAPSIVKGLPISKVAKRLTKFITGDESKVDTSFLEQYDFLILTSGDGLRSLPGAKLKTSFSDFFSFCNVVIPCGMSIESDVIKFGGFDRFFNYSNPIHLGTPSDIPKITVAADLLATSVKFGWPAQDLNNTDNVNGKYSFNNSISFTSPKVSGDPKTLEKVTSYISDPYAQEIIRINLDGKTTTDNSSDNDVFVINVDLDTPQPYALKRVVYDEITGLPDTQYIYNIEFLSPRRIMNRYAQWINSIYYGFKGKQLEFQTTEKNANLSTRQGSTVIRETSIFPIGTDILFKPFYFDVDVSVPIDLVNTLEWEPNRCFSFDWLGKTYKGFLIKAGFAANDQKPQSYKLLCSPDSDLTTLMNYA